MTRTNLLRHRGDIGDDKVGFIELFFDLVFVFAIAQLSHLLLHDLTPIGALKTLMLFLIVWWVWICTTWATNFLSTDSLPVRFMLFAAMLFGLLMSTSIPDAFGGRALPFAIGVAALQVGRTAFLAFALRQGGQMPQYRNFVRIGIWFAIAAIFWIAGALADPETRLYLWGGALVAELATAFIGFWLPGLGRSTTRDWSVSGEHMAERCGLFVIIALGEAVMIAGATFTELAWTTPHTLAFLAAVIAAIAMWWIYFNIGAERAAHHFAHSEDPGALARTAYTYIHMPLVAGIVAMAVAVELALAHPQGHMEPAMRWTACGAAFLFIGGNTLFKRATAGWFPLSHLAGLAIAVALFLAAPGLTPLQMIVAVAALLVTVATWETVSLRGTADRA